jgi:hypothetical protein
VVRLLDDSSTIDATLRETSIEVSCLVTWRDEAKVVAFSMAQWLYLCGRPIAGVCW